MIVALLLAAGASRRFGAPKLLQDFEGKPVVRWSAEALADAPVDELVVVVGPTHEPTQRALAGISARFVVNPMADLGMGSSLACGIAALGDATRAALLALGDEPLVGREPVTRVIERYRAGGAAIVVPTYHGIRGHPVLFDRTVFPELRALSGDHGARAVCDREPDRLALLELDRPKPVDVDVPDDLARLHHSAHHSAPQQPKRP